MFNINSTINNITSNQKNNGYPVNNTDTNLTPKQVYGWDPNLITNTNTNNSNRSRPYLKNKMKPRTISKLPPSQKGMTPKAIYGWDQNLITGKRPNQIFSANNYQKDKNINMMRQSLRNNGVSGNNPLPNRHKTRQALPKNIQDNINVYSYQPNKNQTTNKVTDGIQKLKNIVQKNKLKTENNNLLKQKLRQQTKQKLLSNINNNNNNNNNNKSTVTEITNTIKSDNHNIIIDNHGMDLPQKPQTMRHIHQLEVSNDSIQTNIPTNNGTKSVHELILQPYSESNSDDNDEEPNKLNIDSINNHEIIIDDDGDGESESESENNNTIEIELEADESLVEETICQEVDKVVEVEIMDNDDEDDDDDNDYDNESNNDGEDEDNVDVDVEVAYKRPMGRAPRGKKWDVNNGKWIDKDND